MVAITVDDEYPMLAALTEAVKESPDIESVTEFSTCTAALEWVKENLVDIAFLDIKMRGMGGLALAERILEVNPDCSIVFCTGYSEYAISAFRIHVSGYLMKPITAEAVQAEIDHVKKSGAKEKLLQICCFGYFEVSANGKPLPFKRGKTKELLACLVDCNGAGLTSKQICVKLWEEQGDDQKNMNYLRQLFGDLRKTLQSVGAGDVLIMTGRAYCIDMERVECDYNSYMKSGKPEYRGEYMLQYSWAEETNANLMRDRSIYKMG